MLKNSKFFISVTLRSWSGWKLLAPTTYVYGYYTYVLTYSIHIHTGRYKIGHNN